VYNGTESLTPTANFGSILIKNFIPTPLLCLSGIIIHSLSATEILEDIGNKTTLVSQDQFSKCNDKCVNYCNESTTTIIPLNNWCVLISNPTTIPTRFNITIIFKNLTSRIPEDNNEGRKVKWNSEFLFCLVLVWSIVLFFETL